MKVIGKIVKVGDSLMITIPHKVCSKMKIVKGNHIMFNVIRRIIIK